MLMGMIGLRGLLVTLVLWTGVESQVGRSNQGDVIRAEATAKEQLAKAWSLKRTSFKKDDATRVQILKEAVKSFQVVLEKWPNDGVSCCEASFRMGEIHRSMKALGDAEKAFQKCLSYEEKGGAFRARAMLELGHSRRRVENLDEALDYYERVIAEYSDERKLTSQAVTWSGTMQLRMGDAEKGKKLLLGFEERFLEYPEAAIRNIDKVALWLIENEKVDEARTLVVEADKRFRGKAQEDEKLRAKIVRALSKMRAPSKL